MKKILIASVFAMFALSPAFAATAHHHQAAQSTHGLYMYAPTATIAPPVAMDGARAQALQECSTAAAKWSNSGWETTQLATYGTCMAAHGQQP